MNDQVEERQLNAQPKKECQYDGRSQGTEQAALEFCRLASPTQSRKSIFYIVRKLRQDILLSGRPWVTASNFVNLAADRVVLVIVARNRSCDR
jgi:hypothetical protein